MLNNFSGQYKKSIKPEIIQQDIEVIKRRFTTCYKVEKTSPEQDKQGVDYLVHLNNAGTVGIDVKRREAGAGEYWESSGNPDLPMEIFSVERDGKRSIGWTLKDSKCDYILFLFHPSDTNIEIMLPFQLLKLAFIQNGARWISEYGIKKQKSKDDYGSLWTSSCVFVPLNEVLKTMNDIMLFGTRTFQNH